MNKLAYILGFCVVSVALDASAQRAGAPIFEFSVDRDPIVVGEPFQFTISISTSSEKDPEVRLPAFKGLEVIRQSVSRPMQMSFSFGTGRKAQRQFSSQTVYRFVMVAKKAGKLRIDPVEVQVDGKRYKSKPQSIQVQGGAGSSSPDPGTPGGQTNAPTGAPVDLKNAKVDEDYFIQAHVSKSDVVVGEAMVLTLYAFAAWSGAQFDVVSEPGIEGFWVENLYTGRTAPQTDRVTINNQLYERVAIRKYAIFPLEPGTLTIKPAVVEIVTRSGGFFSRRKSVKRVALPVEIKVAELPKRKQPAGFNPANVGQFSFSAVVDQTEVFAGEPLTLNLEVRGVGNLRNIVLPEIDEIPGFKVYAPESEVDVRYAGTRVTGERRHKILMIPPAAGTFEIPEVSWSFFNSESGEYNTLMSPPTSVTVKPSKQVVFPGATAPVAIETEAPAEDSGGFVRLNRKLRSILNRAELKAHRTSVVSSWWFWALLILPPLGFLTLVLRQRAKRLAEEGRSRGLSKRADAYALKELEGLKKRQAETSREQFYAELQKALLGFLERRLQTAVIGDTMSELNGRLVERGFSPQLASQVTAELESADFARFARTGGDASEQYEAVARACALIKDLSRVKVVDEEGTHA